MLDGHRAVTYAVILSLALAGYAGAPGWVVLAGAACLTLDAWRPWRPDRAARLDWTSKTTTYLVTGAIADLGLAAVAFVAGQMLQWLWP